MNKDKFLQYIKDFNKRDWEKFVPTYFTEDVILETANYRPKGIKDVKKHFIDFSKGLIETLTATKVLVDGNSIAALLHADFEFKEDRPDFRMRPMKKGDSLKISMFVFYETKGDKICSIQFGISPREPGMTVKLV